jgi:hypothetical protein
MSDINTNKAEEQSLWSRIVNNDAAKKGIATAVAGVLIAAVTELVWPSS